MENKFYTPDLTEFHIGFEYEFLQHHGSPKQEWVSLTLTQISDGEDDARLGLTLKALENYDNVYIRNAWRVKCLDTHDLEELGLRGVADEINSGNYRVVSELYYGNNITADEGLHVRAVLVNPNGIQIQSLHIDYYSCITNKYTPLFSGVLLNKSELKRLLSQISIINQKNK